MRRADRDRDDSGLLRGAGPPRRRGGTTSTPLAKAGAPDRALRRADLGRPVALLAVGIGLQVLAPTIRILWTPDLALPTRSASVALLVVACAAVVLRRTRPLVGLAIGLATIVTSGVALGQVHLALLVVVAESLYWAVLEASRRASDVLCWVTSALAAAATVARLATDGTEAAVLTALNAMLFAIPVLWAREVRHHRDAALREAERVAAVREAAVTAERNRMARDLHDVVAGQLSGIALQSEAALTLPDPDPATLRRVLADVRRDSVASLGEMRTMIGLLRDGSDEPLTAPAGLADLDALLARTDVPVRLTDERSGAVLPAAADLVAYRVVAEALTNAGKHAPGADVRLALRERPGELVVEAENDLVEGARSGGGTGTGLLGLTERVEAVGGRVTAGPEARTWRVRACLPT